MPAQKKNDDDLPFKNTKACMATEGLEKFIKVLEKDFFAEVNVQCRYQRVNETTDLILDIHCNFDIAEGLHYFNSDDWGIFSVNSKSSLLNSSFHQAFQSLFFLNETPIDIAELSLHFKDTSVIVARVQEYSITEQLGTIISKLSEHFIYFTNGLTEIPYEIFVPVFEDSSGGLARTVNSTVKNYYEYWVLYFEDYVEQNVMVYTLDTKRLQEEDFFLLY